MDSKAYIEALNTRISEIVDIINSLDDVLKVDYSWEGRDEGDLSFQSQNEWTLHIPSAELNFKAGNYHVFYMETADDTFLKQRLEIRAKEKLIMAFVHGLQEQIDMRVYIYNEITANSLKANQSLICKRFKTN